MTQRTKRPVFTRVAASILFGFSVGCAASSPPPAGQSLADVMASEATFVAGAGLAPDPQQEFGIIVAAELSPGGRVLAALDEVEPHVKVFDLTRHASVAFGSSSDQSDVPLGIAAADDGILLAWSNPRGAELYDLEGHLLRRLGPIPFALRSAASISNGVWLAYGPSSPDDAGRGTWVHCLDTRPGRVSSWHSALADSLEGDESAFMPPLITVARGQAWLEHRRKSPRILSADCTSVTGAPRVNFVAAQNPRAVQSAALSYSGAWPRPPFVVMPVGQAIIIAGTPPPPPAFLAWLPRRARGDRYVFQVLRSGARAEQRVISDSLAIVDARLGASIILQTADPVPRLSVLPATALTRWLGLHQ
jgi:hypothetical protein